MEIFKIGEYVEVLDDAIRGKVVFIKNTLCKIETEDGFILEYEVNELIRTGNPDAILNGSKNGAIESAKEDKIYVNHHRVNTDKKSRKEEYVVEFDLHIEKLIKNFSRMSNFDILNLQVDTARYQLENAIKNRIPKIVFIHGEGEGILKTELEYLFGRYNEISFKEANYRKYGFGATEIYIKQKN